MKFYEFLRGMKSLAVLFSLILAAPSCVGLKATKHTFGAAVDSPEVVVNGARLNMRMKPEGSGKGSYALSAMVVSAAVATLDGPFRWQIQALGEEGVHEAIAVHRVRTRTTLSKRDEWYPAERLNEHAKFKPVASEPGKVRASYHIPGLLNVKPSEDGALDILVDLTVGKVGGKWQRKVVRFRLDPVTKRENEFIFLPTEIVSSIGKDTSEWQDAGWD